MQLIFEIGCEELPASFCQPALAQIEATFAARADELRLGYESLRTVATPRRLTLLVEGLAAKQTDIQEERTGPPAKVAFKDGEPTKAALGFARGQGVDPADLYTVETDKGEYLAANVFEAGQPTAELLPELLREIIQKLNFPKSMRWAERRERFARPVRWILAVADGEVVPLSFAGVDSSNLTRGHRFAAPDAFEVKDIAGYIDGLNAAHVVVDPAERRATIERLLQEMADAAGGVLVKDPDLVDEVTFLLEKPHGIAINFGDAYLELPDEVLISSMRSHQRYFSLATEEGGPLISTCCVIYNTPVVDPKEVYDGNLRVLRARLDDARFFWDKDLKSTLEARLEKLDDVVWLQKLGSMYDRSMRMAALAGDISWALGFDEDVERCAEVGGLLSKVDLLTDMVGEFPDLQGVMGREYALADGEEPAIAQAIHEQYMPGGADDDVPSSDVGAIVALAEKLDALVGCFGIGLIPTSTSDPYALRRAALGVIRILQEREYSISLSELFEMAISAYEVVPDDDDETALMETPLETETDELIEQLLDFASTRLKYQLSGDFPTDVVDAVLAANRDDVLSVRERVEALAALRTEPDFEPLAAGFKRVVNILKKQTEENAAAPVDEALFAEPQESALYAAYLGAQKEVEAAVEAHDWPKACQALISLKSPVDDFFDNVMVMAEDAAQRDNRIALLGELRSLFMRVADISKIQVG
ncbi:glycine--tRNA ligase subunit beta [Bradymonas sediminis]|uniref:Glycine--tRNA ligase beta subunit n=1 Tax=Bradymonas sediminis TaxID=1548548 RepID=A0A2Z4FP96_9DELT|nr:glycine--tRNA ligase subunit beta [Bradymonas sediminis]AWV90837.1 glycine--tRNA ligase subunit beta [Bradymonas sediminis]TDP75428.1 glycyl-tRNA synthetase beta chain [Bradymonas sediminis]